MIELILIAVTVGLMAKIANADDQPMGTWVGVSLALCIAAVFLIPLLFIRILLAGVASILLLVGYKIATGK